MKRTREISVFVDESGSFVPESMDSSSRQYILCMVFHDQSIQIADEIAKLEDALFQMGLKRGHCVHAGPLVRRENEYARMSRQERRGIMRHLLVFFQKVDVAYHCFRVDKHFNTRQDAIHDTLLQQIVGFIFEHKSDFDSYDKLKVYYDNGQAKVKELLKEAFAIYSGKTEFVPQVSPENYRLFQVADLACTLELVKAKVEGLGVISSSESAFFGGEKNLKKNYLKPLSRKLW
ncbi:MAG: DUF3800 domain-containing protein [Kiritimatiellae bacterium]|nr:DUF3800 domain-containing protein [Kiritimatiellia bacterium]